MKTTRRFLLAATAVGVAAAAIPRFPAGAAEFTFRWGQESSPTSPLVITAQKVAQSILQESGGRFEVRVFPSAALGGAQQLLEQTRLGAIDICCTALNYLETMGLGIGALAALPFVFNSHKQAWAAVDGPLGKATVAGVEKLGLHLSERMWEAGFRALSNSVHPVLVPDDMKGLKLRVEPSPVTVSTIRAFGATPTPGQAATTYSELQTHLLDGTNLPLTSLVSFKLYEVQKFASVTNSAWIPIGVFISPASLQKLPRNLAEMLERTINTDATAERDLQVTLDASAEGTLLSNGMIVNHAQIPLFKARIRSAGLYTQWRAQYGAEAFGLLERTTGPLG